MKQQSLFILIVIFLMVSCVPPDKRPTKFESLGISIHLPDKYAPMNAYEYYEYFMEMAKNDSTYVNDQAIRIQNLDGAIPNYLFLQDSTNCHNNILIFQSPYINLNVKSLKQFRKQTYNLLKKQYAAYGIIKTDTSYLSSGTYPYGKNKYILDMDSLLLEINYFHVNMSGRLFTFMVNNNENDFETMIKTLE